LTSSSTTSCCGANTFSDKLEWTADDFTQHGPFELAYHPHDPIELTRELQATAIDTIWVLPYAHKADISIGLNSAIVDVCSSLENSKRGKGLKRAVVAFTVHPEDGLKGVEEATLRALLQGNAKVAKLHCSVGRYSVLNENLQPFWKLANKVHFPIVVHFGSSESGNTASQELIDVKELLEMYPEVRLIIAHSGHPAVVRGIKLAMQYDHVYLDTTPVGESCYSAC
jgi:predicted TIM-barrel fold metal-dependent hydrolase